MTGPRAQGLHREGGLEKGPGELGEAACAVQMARDAQMSRRRTGPPGQSRGLKGSPPKYVYVLISRTRIP